MKNKAVMAISALAATGALIYGSRFAFASTDQPVTPITEEFRLERRANTEAGFEAKLGRAVEAGELTAEQKQLILEKREEFRAGCDETGARRQEHHEEMLAWAQENGIDLSLMMGMGKGQGQEQHRGIKGMGRRMHQQR